MLTGCAEPCIVSRMTAYHFVGATLRDGRPVPTDGEWLEHNGEIRMCVSGLHASEHPFDALQYAPGEILCLVDIEGDIERQDDKLVGRRRSIVKRFNATELLWAFSRECALSVIHLWDAPDVVKQYIQTGDEALRAAARDAAWAAAWAAARDAAWYAARAAWDAARDAARDAAWYAAWDAASDAAWAAAWAAARAASDAARAAWDAASDAARAAARAASDAARAAARDAQRNQFKAAVDAAFEAIP